MTCNSVQDMNLDKDSCMEPNPISEYILHIHICVTHQWKSAHMTWIFHLTICPNMFWKRVTLQVCIRIFWKQMEICDFDVEKFKSNHQYSPVSGCLSYLTQKREILIVFVRNPPRVLLLFCKPSTRFSLVNLFWRFKYRIILLH